MFPKYHCIIYSLLWTYIWLICSILELTSTKRIASRCWYFLDFLQERYVFLRHQACKHLNDKISLESKIIGNILRVSLYYAFFSVFILCCSLYFACAFHIRRGVERTQKFNIKSHLIQSNSQSIFQNADIVGALDFWIFHFSLPAPQRSVKIKI